MDNERAESRLAQERTVMTYESCPSAVAFESETASVTFIVQATEKYFREQARIRAVEEGAGFLDGIGLSGDELIRDHEIAARYGF